MIDDDDDDNDDDDDDDDDFCVFSLPQRLEGARHSRPTSPSSSWRHLGSSWLILANLGSPWRHLGSPCRHFGVRRALGGLIFELHFDRQISSKSSSRAGESSISGISVGIFFYIFFRAHFYKT